MAKTYPKVLVVPSLVMDEVVASAAKWRRGGRVPVLTWQFPPSALGQERRGGFLCHAAVPDDSDPEPSALPDSAASPAPDGLPPSGLGLSGAGGGSGPSGSNPPSHRKDEQQRGRQSDEQARPPSMPPL
jgi:hypothetical protein